MSSVENMSVRAQRTRRNVVKMGVVLAPVALAKIKRATGVPACAIGCNCFLKGTKIQTAEGERQVETLATGDLLPTMFGGIRPIQWIGRYPFRRTDPSKPWPKDVHPIRIAPSAFSPRFHKPTFT